jgi:hypothetical protein
LFCSLSFADWTRINVLLLKADSDAGIAWHHFATFASMLSFSDRIVVARTITFVFLRRLRVCWFCTVLQHRVKQCA